MNWTIEQFRNYFKKKKPNKYRVADKSLRYWSGNFRGREQTILFDSYKELVRFTELLSLEKAGAINYLNRQEPFILTGGIKYYADFVYYDKELHKWVIEDVKSYYTSKLQSYIRTRKMVMELYPDMLFKEVIR